MAQSFLVGIWGKGKSHGAVWSPEAFEQLFIIHSPYARHFAKAFTEHYYI